MAVACGSPAGIPPHRGLVVFRAHPRLHHLRVRVVAARGQQHALGCVDAHVSVAVLSDAADHTTAVFADELHGGHLIANLQVVVGFGNRAQLLAHVQAEQPRSADTLGHLEVDVAVDDGETVVVRRLVELVQLPTRTTLVEHILPEIGYFARPVHVRFDGAGVDAPIRSTVDLIAQLSRIDINPLLLLELRAHRAETLPRRASLGHLLQRDDLRALLGRLQTAHQPADAGADDENLALLGRADLRFGDITILERDRPARTGKISLAQRAQRRIVTQSLGILVA